MANQVQHTLDYQKFQTIVANRTLVRNHINNLKTALKEHPEILQAQPILVNENFFIIDGQHRFVAATELGMPIYFTVVPGLNIDTARAMNILQRPWQPLDFAKSYAMTGNVNYKQYLEAREDFRFGHLIIVAALVGKRQHNAALTFRRGEFEVDNLERGRKWLERINEVASLSTVPMISPYAYALLQAFNHPDFKYDRFIDKLQKYGGQILKPYTQINDYLRAIEEIYNMVVQNKTRLF